MRLPDTLRNGLEALGLVPSDKSRAIADALLQEHEADKLARRRSLAHELTATIAAEGIAFRRAETERLPLVDALDRAEAAVLEARERLFAFDAAARAEAWEFYSASQRIQGELRRTASPLIDEFVRELIAMIDATYMARDSCEEEMASGNIRETWTNVASIQTRVAAIRAALDECRESGTLPYRSLAESELREEIDRMRRAIPDLEEPPARVRRIRERPIGAGVAVEA